VSHSATESALNSIVAIEKTLPIECKTEGIKSQLESVKTQIETIKLGCESEKAQLRSDKIKWQIAFWAMIVVVSMYFLRKRI
jgi:hypothetical protein